ncbi:probable citrate synthase 2, mitochondrial [Hylaeus anthracinus]|uniref:probable citrate synthase 2, mitochondrial n=1 Tax=Hylaeus anthracinus TaxID=313031 RepID=UPI0023BA3C49|nr:probable citrate synthase 2, mitochondrial [Hylaeus anthracinus]
MREFGRMFQAWRGVQHANLQMMIMGGVKNHTSNSNYGGRRHVLTVSTTRGTPSTSTDLKEALCEKIPLHYDLLRNFRRQHGPSVVSHITVENMYQGLNGVNTMVRETCETDAKYGIKYRGLTIPEVVTLLPRQGKSPSAEAVFWLLLTGDVPTHEQTASLIADWTSRRQKRKDWWSGPGGGIVGSVLQTLPKTTSPLGRLSVALTVFDSSKHIKEALKNRAASHTHWEYTYEDSMELLATLPAIVGLTAKAEGLRDVKDEGDWVQFLLECLSNASQISENHQKSLLDFLRLYVTLNADEDGGVPAVHVTEILGASQLDVNQALAAGVLAYAVEPNSGTLAQYMEFQTKIQALLGRDLKEEKLTNYVTLIAKDKLIGYQETEICDPRYTALINYVKDNMADNADAKLSQAIARILTTKIKTAKGRVVYPEQSTIAAPVFQSLGLKDMNFNQVLLCMSRALGAVASIIWTKAVNAPVERPASKCTYTYLDSIQGTRRKQKRGKHVKHSRK